MLREDNNVLNNFEPYKDEKSILEEQNIEKNHKDLVDQSLNTRNYIRNNFLICFF